VIFLDRNNFYRFKWCTRWHFLLVGGWGVVIHSKAPQYLPLQRKHAQSVFPLEPPTWIITWGEYIAFALLIGSCMRYWFRNGTPRSKLICNETFEILGTKVYSWLTVQPWSFRNSSHPATEIDGVHDRNVRLWSGLANVREPIKQNIYWFYPLFVPKRVEVIGGRRKQHCEELRNLFFSPNKIRIIKWRRVTLAGHGEKNECRESGTYVGG
jgi:hypothetical protein